MSAVIRVQYCMWGVFVSSTVEHVCLHNACVLVLQGELIIAVHHGIVQ